DFGDLMYTKGYGSYTAYKRSKLCNILFTRALAKRLSGTGVTANCLHPGFVATRFGNEAGGLFAYAIRVAKMIPRTPEKDAETLIHLASPQEVATASGGYFEDCRVSRPDPTAEDDALAERLWRESEKIVGIAG